MAEVLHLSALLNRRIVGSDGTRVGRLTDVVVRLGEEGYPAVTGLVADVADSAVFLPPTQLGELDADPLALTRPQVDLRRFERRDGEVLLRADVLRHRLLHVPDARLVRAWDVELVRHGPGWVLGYLDTRRPRRLFGLLAAGAGHPREDWKSFAPLLGHAPTARWRGLVGRLRGMRPAQIADLLEDASSNEQSDILQAVHADPELEADVFEELEPERQHRLLGNLSDQQVADVLARMQADDAADAVAELPQGRRQAVLGRLPRGQYTKVLTLLGYNPDSAGGLMEVDYLGAAADVTVAEALELAAAARSLPRQALLDFYLTDADGRLVGVAGLSVLLAAAPTTRLADIAEADPVHVHAEADVIEVALRMSDYDLVTIPVVDDEHHLTGIITVDDVLEATIPADWRRRETDEHEAHAIDSQHSPIG